MKPKIYIFDTESSDLYATWGSLLCFTWMEPHEKKAHIMRISDYPLFKKDPTNDRELVKDIKKKLEEADMLFGWYSTRHDIPLINSRLIYHGLKPVSPRAHVDGWKVAKYHLCLPSNSLKMVSSFLEIEEKTPIKPNTWKRARAGHLSSLKYVYEHGLQDTVVTKLAYERMLPLIQKHPNVFNITDFTNGCPRCGAKGRMVKNGIGYAEKRAHQVYECQKCGGHVRGHAI